MQAGGQRWSDVGGLPGEARSFDNPAMIIDALLESETLDIVVEVHCHVLVVDSRFPGPLEAPKLGGKVEAEKEAAAERAADLGREALGTLDEGCRGDWIGRMLGVRFEEKELDAKNDGVNRLDRFPVALEERVRDAARLHLDVRMPDARQAVDSRWPEGVVLGEAQREDESAAGVVAPAEAHSHLHLPP